jgi:hypothetical protein
MCKSKAQGLLHVEDANAADLHFHNMMNWDKQIVPYRPLRHLVIEGLSPCKL